MIALRKSDLLSPKNLVYKFIRKPDDFSSSSFIPVFKKPLGRESKYKPLSKHIDALCVSK